MKMARFQKNIEDREVEKETVHSFDPSIGIAGIFYTDTEGTSFPLIFQTKNAESTETPRKLPWKSLVKHSWK